MLLECGCSHQHCSFDRQSDGFGMAAEHVIAKDVEAAGCMLCCHCQVAVLARSWVHAQSKYIS